ncbi:MAG TPA: hypothetical protein VEK38_02115, partial [Candidatus Bathyarchaeia archaeon]|nr:hypothetical protein [Candidatus Bathyarchaeia archaeon]
MKLSYFAYRILPFFCVSIFFVPCTAYADQHSFSYGHNALLKSYVATTPPALITNNEWQELALDQLLKNIDTTKTVGGPWGLATVITPTTDIAVIEQRQAAVRFLVEHPNIHKRLQEILTYIAHHELHVWTYWNAHDALSISAQSLYYHVPLSSSIGWVKKFENFLNNSSSILEASILAETGSLVSSFAASICLNGLHTEFIRWLLDNNNQPLNLWQGFLNTLKQPFVQHSFALDICKEAPPAQ